MPDIAWAWSEHSVIEAATAAVAFGVDEIHDALATIAADPLKGAPVLASRGLFGTARAGRWHDGAATLAYDIRDRGRRLVLLAAGPRDARTLDRAAAARDQLLTCGRVTNREPRIVEFDDVGIDLDVRARIASHWRRDPSGFGDGARFTVYDDSGRRTHVMSFAPTGVPLLALLANADEGGARLARRRAATISRLIADLRAVP